MKFFTLIIILLILKAPLTQAKTNIQLKGVCFHETSDHQIQLDKDCNCKLKEKCLNITNMISDNEIALLGEFGASKNQLFFLKNTLSEMNKLISGKKVEIDTSKEEIDKIVQETQKHSLKINNKIKSLPNLPSLNIDITAAQKELQRPAKFLFDEDNMTFLKNIIHESFPHAKIGNIDKSILLSVDRQDDQSEKNEQDVQDDQDDQLQIKASDSTKLASLPSAINTKLPDLPASKKYNYQSSIHDSHHSIWDIIHLQYLKRVEAHPEN